MYGGIINSPTGAKAEEGESSTCSRAEPQRGGGLWDRSED